MKEDDIEKFAAKLGKPDLAKIAEKERREREAKVVKENAAFILKHIEDHQKFLCLMHAQDLKYNESTINILSEMATETIKSLNQCLSQMKAEEVDSLALNCTSRKVAWPINVSTSMRTELQDQVSYIFDTLKLGDNSIFNVRYKRKTRSDGKKAKIAQEAMFQMLLNVERYRVKYQDGGGKEPYNLAGQLDPLCASNAVDWFKLIVRILEDYSEGKPWTIPFNSSLSDSLSELTKTNDCLRKRFKTPSELKAETKDGIRRDAFRKKLWAAFLFIMNPKIRDALRSDDGTDRACPSMAW